jgi:hypothetical protein
MKISASAVLAIAALAGGFYFWKKRAGIVATLTPQSAAEKQVNDLYGTAQAWRGNPVYNTPGKPGYIPTLPPSYAPGTGPAAVYVPPSAYIGPPPDLPVGTSYSDASDATAASEASMFGLGGLGRFRFFDAALGRRAQRAGVGEARTRPNLRYLYMHRRDGQRGVIE